MVMIMTLMIMTFFTAETMREMLTRSPLQKHQPWDRVILPWYEPCLLLPIFDDIINLAKTSDQKLMAIRLTKLQK